MRERSLLLASVTIAVVAIANLTAQQVHAAAGDDCITKPNSPAPHGLHWYYRIDHANNRQCWRLGPEGIRVQKSTPPIEKEAAPAPVARPVEPARAQRSETTGAAVARAEASRAEAAPDLKPAVAATVAAPSPWPDSPRMPDLPPSVQTGQQPEAPKGTQTASAADAVPVVSADNSASATAKESQAAAPVEEPSQPTTPPAWAKNGEVDHTFALLMIVFAVIAISGPIIHFVDRRRRRRVIISDQEPPRWARVVALNAPTPRVQVPLASDPPIAKRPAPIPPMPIEHSERLAEALRQLVDQLPRRQTGAATHPVQHSDVEMTKKRSVALRS